MTEPSSLGMVLPSSATASARHLVQVKEHLVAQMGYMPMFHSAMDIQAVTTEANVNRAAVCTS